MATTRQSDFVTDVDVSLAAGQRELVYRGPIIANRSAAAVLYRRWGKRLLDIMLSAVMLVALLPLMAVVALAVLVTSGWPVWHRSQRVGAGGREFWMLKFRTMRRDADQSLSDVLAASPERYLEFRRTRKLRGDPRISPCGRLLRVLSIDELPQLVNVLLGHMSLVGPRPVPRSELQDMYGPLSAHVLSVRPGITGMWQVNGRSRTPYVERVRYDCIYAADLSFLQDLRILMKTVPVVLRREGAE